MIRNSMFTPTFSSEAFSALFPVFRDHPEVVEGVLAQARRQKFPSGASIYWEGDVCSAIAFVLEGQIRVYKSGETGREITLYEIGPGETCILNASCILGNNSYPANAVTSSPIELLLLPAAAFRRLLSVHEPLRTFVFYLLSERLTAVMQLVDEVAFGRMDERLLEYVVRKASDGVLTASHQKIANDLGTSREVVSRLLKDFERQGRVMLARNAVSLIHDAERN